jgi:hypothetical protein
MAALANQQLVGTGLAPAFSAAAGGGDTCTPGDKTFLVVKNGGGSPITVTLAAFPDTAPWGAAIPDPTVSVPAAGERWIGPLVGSSYANPSTGTVGISYSGVTSVTVGAFTF